MNNADRWIKILCILIMAVLIVLAILLISDKMKDRNAQAEPTTTPMPMPMPSSQDVRIYSSREFNYALNMQSVSTFPSGYRYDDIFWYEITPKEWAGYTDWRLVKHETSGITCLIYGEEIFPITLANLTSGIQLWGFGLMDVLLTDCDADRQYELIVSASYEIEGGYRSAILLIDNNEQGQMNRTMLNLSVDNRAFMLNMDENGNYVACEAEVGFTGTGTTDWRLDRMGGDTWTFACQNGELILLEI